MPEDDYRKDALDLTFKYSLSNKRNLSLADNIIRLILDKELISDFTKFSKIFSKSVSIYWLIKVDD